MTTLTPVEAREDVKPLTESEEMARAILSGAHDDDGVACLLLRHAYEHIDALRARLATHESGGWRAVDDGTPKDRPILFYAPGREGLSALQGAMQWHPDAGFCVDELRHPTHWREYLQPPSPSQSVGKSCGDCEAKPGEEHAADCPGGPGHQSAPEGGREDPTADEPLVGLLNAAGLAVVPREPTERMLHAGEQAYVATYPALFTADVWRAMLSAGALTSTSLRERALTPPGSEGRGALAPEELVKRERWHADRLAAAEARALAAEEDVKRLRIEGLRFLEIIGEGGRKGRALDLIDRGSIDRFRAALSSTKKVLPS